MNQPVRVLHFQGRMGKGGAETFMMNTYRNIDRSKIQFDFLIYNDFKDVTPYNKEILELGGRIFSVPNPKKNMVGYLVSVRKLLKENKFNIVHNEVFFGGGLNLWLSYKAGIKKRIAHSHATTDGKSSIAMKLIRKVLDSLMFKYATDYLACSVEAGKGLFGKNHPFLFVPNGIDLNYFQNITESKGLSKKKIGLPEDAFVTGNIGRLEEQKNHRFLISIFEEVYKTNKNSHLILIGEGSLENEIKDIVRQKKLDQVVHFLGVRDDIPTILNAMEVFLMPSLYEGLPISAVEAQAAGVKLVLSTEVSEETALSENVQFVPLALSAEEWAIRILERPYGNKLLPEMEMYDMRNTAQIMEKVYLN